MESRKKRRGSLHFRAEHDNIANRLGSAWCRARNIRKVINMNEETIPAVPGTETTDFLQSSKSHALQAAEELKAAAALKAQQLREAAGQSAARFRETAAETTKKLRETAEERAVRAREYANQQWQSARTYAKDWQEQGEAYVRENPAKAVLAALGVGFVLGLIFRR